MLRQQPENRKNYNMVSRVTELLSSYNNNMYYSTQENIYENIKRTLETLNEFVQGPCPENQQELLDGDTFFEIAYKIMNVIWGFIQKKKLRFCHRFLKRSQTLKKHIYTTI